MTDKKTQIAVFISGTGSNMKALIDATNAGILDAEIALVVSSSAKAFGLSVAREGGIDTFIFKEKTYSSTDQAGQDLLRILKEAKIDYIALAGYLRLLPGQIVKEYSGRITNIHNALLPKYGGKGMYGRHVHEAVLASGDTESGATIHLVDEIYDNGRILKQVKVPVKPGDTPETLAQRVLAVEHKYYARVLNKLIKGEYR
jgi:phosphoribosylglycinamide formyltransferase-1